MKKFFCLTLISLCALSASSAFASGIVNWYEMMAHGAFGDSDHVLTERLIAIGGGIFTTVVILLIGLRYRASASVAQSNGAPDSKVSVRSIVEMALDAVYGIAKENCGDDYRNFFPLLATIFLFILISNLGGLIPGFPPATENIATNLALGLTVFIVYHFSGIKEHGPSYVKQFLGPMIFIAPLLFIIELISHAARPLSLSLRLMGNVFADHLMLGIFTENTKLVVPALLMFFGFLVALIQSFVFTLLSGIYISMSISHDH